MIYMYLFKRYVGDPDICICYIAPVQNPVPPHLAFASARRMALRRLAAGWALDFEEELCSTCICIYIYVVETHRLFNPRLDSATFIRSNMPKRFILEEVYNITCP